MKPAPVVDRMPVTITGMLAQIGRSVVSVSETFVGLIDMLGAVLVAAGGVFLRPRDFRRWPVTARKYARRRAMRSQSAPSRWRQN